VAEAAVFGPSPAERAESRDDSLRLKEALGRMRGNYREAIVLRFGLGLTIPEIARHLQISLPAAKKLVLRATQQARKRLAAIEGEEFCPEMRDLARRSLFEKEASGLASEAEERILHAHFEHCGSCRSFLASLHELGSGALLAGAASDQLSGKIGVVDHLARWLGNAAHAVGAGTAKLRFAAFKATGALQPGDAGTAGALAGTGQKIAAICTAGAATTATCLATGIVGPGIGVTAPPVSGSASPPAQVKTVSDPLAQPPAPAPAPEPAPTPMPESSSGQASEQSSQPPPAPPPSETPAQAQQGHDHFGVVEGSPPPEPAPEPPPTPPASTTGSGSSSSSSGGGSGGASGTDSFGFHG
jgi:hypothetical protein